MVWGLWHREPWGVFWAEWQAGCLYCVCPTGVRLLRSLPLSGPQFPHFNLISPRTSLGGLWVPSISTFAEGKVGPPPEFLCWPPGVTVTNDRKLGNENHRNVFSPGSGGPKSRCWWAGSFWGSEQNLSPSFWGPQAPALSPASVS